MAAGQAGAAVEQIAEGRLGPAGDVRQAVDDAIDAIDDAGEPDADRGGVRPGLAKLGDPDEQGIDEGGAIAGVAGYR